MKAVVLLLSLLLGLAIIGCGGGGGSSSTGGTTSGAATSVKFGIAWAARSRQILGPSSALSATITLSDANSAGGDLTFDVNRATGAAAYTQTYSTTETAKPGTYPFAIAFYDQTNGAGDVVATGNATVTIASDGSGVGSISVTNAVKTVTVDPNQTLTIGQATQLTFTARDSSSNIIAVTTGSGVWSEVDGNGVFALSPSGVATATSAGSGHVTVTVDSITSLPVVVTAAVGVTDIRFSLSWGPRSRNQGPGSALSATLTLSGANPAGGDFVVEEDRSSSPAAYTQAYTTATPSNEGTFPMTITFYAETGGGGAIVGQGQANVTINADGTGVGTVSIVDTVASVSIDPNQTLLPGQSTQLTFTARDKNGSIVAVTEGSGIWTQVDGTSVMTIANDGTALGITAGTAHATVTVDGIVSPPSAITVPASVDFQNAGFEAPVLPAGTSLEPGPASSLWSGTPNWGIANGAGSWGTGAHSGNQYAFIQGAGSIDQTVNGLTVGQTYQVTLWIARRNGNAGGNQGEPISVIANGITIVPQTPPKDDASWIQVASQNFTASQTNCTFVIQGDPIGTADQSTLIDDVHLTAVP